MARTISEMAEKGRRKLDQKSTRMKDNYDAAKTGMKDSYNNLPFNSRMKEAYRQGVDDAEYVAPDADKWQRNWVRKVS